MKKERIIQALNNEKVLLSIFVFELHILMLWGVETYFHTGSILRYSSRSVFVFGLYSQGINVTIFKALLGFTFTTIFPLIFLTLWIFNRRNKSKSLKITLQKWNIIIFSSFIILLIAKKLYSLPLYYYNSREGTSFHIMQIWEWYFTPFLGLGAILLIFYWIIRKLIHEYKNRKILLENGNTLEVIDEHNEIISKLKKEL